MRPALLTSTIMARVEAHVGGQTIRPTYIVGSPGIGKTQIPRQITHQLGIGHMEIHGPLMLAEDYGMPHFVGKEIEFATPGHKFPFVDTDCPDTGVIVVDELGQMDVPQQKIQANMFQERELHGRRIKPGWHFVATGNRQQDRAGANRILSHLNDRITTYELDVSHEDWHAWALANSIKPEVMAFLSFRPDLLNKFDPAKDKNSTPRGWAEGVNRSIGTVPKEAEYETYCGDVGEGAATEFMAFIKIFRELPDPDLVLADPSRHPVPTDMSTLYALAGALAHRSGKDNFDAVLTYAKRMPPEFTVLLVRDSMRMSPDVQHTKAFVQWATGEGADLLM